MDCSATYRAALIGKSTRRYQIKYYSIIQSYHINVEFTSCPTHRRVLHKYNCNGNEGTEILYS